MPGIAGRVRTNFKINDGARSLMARDLSCIHTSHVTWIRTVESDSSHDYAFRQLTQYHTVITYGELELCIPPINPQYHMVVRYGEGKLCMPPINPQYHTVVRYGEGKLCIPPINTIQHGRQI